MPRSPVLFATLVLTATTAAADDLPPWMTPQPAQPSASAPAGATAPAADPDITAFAELLDLVATDPELVRKLRQADKARSSEALAAIWTQDLKPHERARFTWIAAHLREGADGRLATPRATALLVLGPPQSMHSEPARSWTGQSFQPVDDLQVLRARLRGERAPTDAAPLPLSGELPTEVWVYPGGSVNELRVLTFVDEDRDGTFRFVSDAVVPVSPPPSAAPGVEPPADLFPPLETGAAIGDLPALTDDGLPVAVDQVYFKASAGRTFTRFVISVDPSDVETELDGDPAAYAATAQAVVRVERDGVPAWQGTADLAKQPGATESTPWLVELSQPLPPGTYQATALVRDASGKGGKKSWTLEVPSYGGRLALSSPVVARLTGSDLPKAPAAAGETLAPFQVGNYIVRPAPGARFRRGESAAFVVQAYDAPSATIEYKLYRDGVFQSVLEPTKIPSLPSTQITIQEITSAFTDGSYELQATVTSSANPSEKVTVKMPFRVRG